MENTLEQNVIKVLKKARKNRKLTQDDVAQAIGTSSKTIYRVESLLVPLSLSMFFDICGVYQISPENVIKQARG